jgi:hypothetical protein
MQDIYSKIGTIPVSLGYTKQKQKFEGSLMQRFPMANSLRISWGQLMMLISSLAAHLLAGLTPACSSPQFAS